MRKESIQTLKIEWWNNHRILYNKGLAIAGVGFVVVTSLLFLSFNNSKREFITALVIGTIVYFAYMATLNLIYLLLELADRSTTISINQRTRSSAFKLLFWFSVLFPFSYPTIIFTMAYI